MSIVNLNKARKAKAKAEKKTKADANAAKFGRTKAEKARDTALADKESRTLDDHKRDR